MFNWILSRDGEKRIGKCVSGAADGDFTFLHGLQQRGLSFGGSAVNFVRKQDVGEDWTLDEAELAPSIFVLVEHIGARDVRGHQVGGKLNTIEAYVDDTGERADHQSLGQTWNSLEQAVPASKNCGE